MGVIEFLIGYGSLATVVYIFKYCEELSDGNIS